MKIRLLSSWLFTVGLACGPLANCAHRAQENSKSSVSRRDPKTLVSPFASTVVGVTIPNAHYIGSSNLVLRGQRPMTPVHAQELHQVGVDQVVIFRNESAGETNATAEIEMLGSAGITQKQITVIPFQWKDITDIEAACRQTVQALQIMHDSTAAHKKVFVHCTIGEDRTGFLAGIYRVLTENGAPEAIFNDEMCRWGFAFSDSEKPAFVAELVRKNIGPVFAYMSYLTSKGSLSWNHLKSEACHLPPGSDSEVAAYTRHLEANTNGLSCKKLQ